MFGTSLRYVLFLLLSSSPAVALAQEPPREAAPSAATSEAARETPREPRVRILSPETTWVDVDTFPRPVKLWGDVSVGGFYVYPGWEPGPYGSPPARIVSAGGWGVTLWRDPITGWPLQ